MLPLSLLIWHLGDLFRQGQGGIRVAGPSLPSSFTSLTSLEDKDQMSIEVTVMFL